MTASATPRMAGARAVRLRLTLRYEMRCGYPGAGRLLVTFPSAMHLPQRLAFGAVRLAGKPRAVKVEGHRVTVTVPPHKGMLCDLMGPGALTLAFTRAAKLANSARAGSYVIKATHGGRFFAAGLAIEADG